jgi:nicotinamidase-related amidase
MELEPARTALLLVDVQNDYWSPPRKPRPRFLDAARDLLELARTRGFLVVHVQHARRDGSGKSGFVPGTPGFEVHDAVAPLDDEPRVVKHAPSAFFETGLDELLRRHRIENVVVAGIQTQKCCDTTTREASARGYRCFFASDAVETFDLTGPDGAVVDRDEIARVTFATLHNGFARVLPVGELARLATPQATAPATPAA